MVITHTLTKVKSIVLLLIQINGTSASNKENYHIFLLEINNFHLVQHLGKYPRIFKLPKASDLRG